jgi:hypothetical protein
MSMRALLLLIGLLVIGNAEALAAVNAPLAVEPRGAEPREDLFATRPRSAVPATAPAVAPTPAAAEPVLTGNPLWGIPLGRLTQTREKPLFAPTRHPPAAVAKPAPAPMAAASKPPEPEKPQLSLLGTVVGSAAHGVGLFIDSANKSVLRLKVGENHKGWILRAVHSHQVELARGLDSAVLNLPPPDMKPAAGGPPPVMPAVAGAPGNPALPVNTARAPGPPAMPTPVGATIIVQQPTFNPPPVPVNPFQNKRLP